MNHGGMEWRGFWIPGLASLARNDEKKRQPPERQKEATARPE